MNRLTGMFVGLSLVMLAASPVWSQDAKEDVKKPEASKATPKKADAQTAKKGRQNPLANRTLKELEPLKLSEEQKKQIQTLAAEFQPKIQAARKKVNELIPEEQRKARQEAVAKAKAEGKKAADVVTAFKPTPEQAAAQAALKEVNTTFNKKVTEVLTQEQKQARRKARQEAGEKKPADQKKPAAKTEKPKAE